MRQSKWFGAISICLIWMFVFNWDNCPGQDVQSNTRFIDGRKQLTNRLVTHLIEDHRGDIWVGTDDGINLYDGDDFTKFKHMYDPPFRINGIALERFFTEKNGNLVLYYLNQKNPIVDILNPVTFDLQTIQLSKIFPSDHEIIDLIQGPGEQILTLFYCADSISIHELELDGTAKQLLTIKNTGFRRPVKMFATSESYWLVYDDGTVLSYGIRGDYQRQYQSPSSSFKKIKLDEFVNDLHEWEDGTIWISFEAVPGMYKIVPDVLMPVKDALLPGDQLFSKIWKDKMGNRMVYAGNSFVENEKLFVIDPQREKIKDVTDWYGIKSQINAVFARDFNSGCFLGSPDGIHMIKRPSNVFVKGLNNPIQKGEWGTSVRGIAKDNRGHIIAAREINNWFDMNAGLTEVDTLDIVENEVPFEVKFKCSRDLISHGPNIYGSVHLPDDSYGLVSYNSELNSVSLLDAPNHIQNLKLRNDKIWMACGENDHEGALLIYDTKSGKLVSFVDETGKNPFAESFLNVLCFETDSTLLIGANDGLYMINTLSKEVQFFERKARTKMEILDTYIYDLLLHSAGQLYIGYRSGGFAIHDLSTGETSLFTSNDGLPDDNIATMVEDRNGNVWIATFYGLSRFNPESRTFVNFYEEDGIPHNEFNRYSSFQDSDGRLYFGGLNGMISFDPDSILLKEEKPLLILTSVTYRDRSENLQTVRSENVLEVIQLPAAYRSLVCDFKLDNYLNSNGNHYAYRLIDDKDQDQDWTSIGSNSFVRLEHLPAGDRKLQIKGFDKYGNESQNILELSLCVDLFFYQTWWFILLAFCTLGLGVYWFLQNRFNARVKLLRIRQEISRDLHDEVGSLLSGMAMKSELLGMNVPPKFRAEAEKVSQMGRDAVRQMRDIVWSLDSRKKSMQDLFDRIEEFAVESFEDKKINFHMKAQNLTMNRELNLPIRKNLYLIMREAITNIVKHSDASEVRIELSQENRKLKLEVKDNGNVVTKNHNGSGFGLKNMRERANEIGGIIEIDKSNGYDIKIEIPLSANLFDEL